jgi:hypothetical protein
VRRSEHVEVLAGVADRVADLLEAAEVQRLPRRPSGDHRDGGHLLGEPDQHLAGVGVDVRLRRVLDDRRQDAVEVQPHGGGGGHPHQGGVATLGLRRGEVHAGKPTRRQAVPPSRSRQPVRASR